ncbi:MAG: hypothetical protein SNH01_03265 [Rikenellaceae bacterium]
MRSIFSSIWFNFHYLPFKQAVKLPILLYKPKLLRCQGTISIESDKVKFGLIKLGKYNVSIYPNSGIIYENKGGSIVFKGKCNIGNNSAISIGKSGSVIFGDRFVATSTMKLVSYNKIVFGERVRIGWESLVMDTDMHRLTKVDGGYSKGYGDIIIGDNNWFGTKCTIFKNTVTPNYAIFASGSITNRRFDYPEYSLIGVSNKLEVKASGIWRDIDNDVIEYR